MTSRSVWSALGIRRLIGGADDGDRPWPAVAIGLNECGLVVFSSADGTQFRMVERLASHAQEATAMFAESSAPTLMLHDVRRLYGPEIALMRLV